MSISVLLYIYTCTLAIFIFSAFAGYVCVLVYIIIAHMRGHIEVNAYLSAPLVNVSERQRYVHSIYWAAHCFIYCWRVGELQLQNINTVVTLRLYLALYTSIEQNMSNIG